MKKGNFIFIVLLIFLITAILFFVFYKSPGTRYERLAKPTTSTCSSQPEGVICQKGGLFGKDLFCLNGQCVICPSSNVRCEDICAPPGSICCGEYICSSPSQQCLSKTITIFTEKYCNPVTCPPEKPKLCSDSTNPPALPPIVDKDICCTADSMCVKQETWLGSAAHCGSTGACAAPKISCPGATGTITPPGASICCEADEVCKSITKYGETLPFCAANCEVSRPGFKCCGGIKDKSDISIWCNANDTCSVHPNGSPKCLPGLAPAPPPTHPPSGEPADYEK